MVPGCCLKGGSRAIKEPLIGSERSDDVRGDARGDGRNSRAALHSNRKEPRPTLHDHIDGAKVPLELVADAWVKVERANIDAIRFHDPIGVRLERISRLVDRGCEVRVRCSFDGLQSTQAARVAQKTAREQVHPSTGNYGGTEGLHHASARIRFACQLLRPVEHHARGQTPLQAMTLFAALRVGWTMVGKHAALEAAVLRNQATNGSAEIVGTRLLELVHERHALWQQAFHEVVYVGCSI